MTTSQNQPFFCPNCGGKNLRLFNFCQACGKPLTQNAPTPAIPQIAAAPPLATAAPVNIQQEQKTNLPCLLKIFFALVAAVVIMVGIGSQVQQKEETEQVIAVATPLPLPAPNQEEIRRAKAEAVKRETEYKEHQKRLARQERQRQARGRQLLSDLRSDRDEIKEITWYKSWGAPEYSSERTAFYLYFGKQNGATLPLRMKFQYVSDEWLFIEKFTIKAGSETFTVEPSSHFSVERDNEGGSIWEWYDQIVEGEQMNMIEKMFKSRKVIIRYEGQQYYRDYTLKDSEKEDLKIIYEAYKANI